MAELVVVANRLPVAPAIDADGTVTWEPSPGGLVTALTPVLLARRGAWVGWPGTRAGVEGEPQAPAEIVTEEGLRLHPVELDDDDYERFYEGFANATLWPLLHGLIVAPRYEGDWWESYREVNHRYALAAAERADHGATVWVQDYQLMLVPGILRQLRPDLTIGFFLHIPFPAPEIFRQLPWREEVIRGLLGADLVGFHLDSCADNFLELCRNIPGHGSAHTGLPDTLEVTGASSVRRATGAVTAPDGRRVRVGSFPISIDSAQVIDRAGRADAARVRRLTGDPAVLLAGVDRLDYTKGILRRLEAFEELLATGALDPAETVLVQVATPSRERVADYRRLRAEVEHAVGRINGRFARLGRPVIHYLHRPVAFDRLLELYRATDIMLVTALRDGMNLVCKEYVACHADASGALVLSEFTGAATELDGAHLCNPHDIESVKRAVMAAVHADPADARERMARMHAQVRDHDVDLWAGAFLGELAAAHAGGGDR
ncbi:alpha,alpha-trehalose-phosphate synthase (UDP-forming) [Corynebacterium sphenisci]|uniref:alpha,alpha-trehalose-phosphate synthase (UDP-forming) n=1 Tax=Corynebacterium sphenisci TaxID=191493 RepID=UPI0026DF6DD3|nr:trehalose-6-phosphate synthase [Corynebacterium sphenisci]MDO5730131.1 trehalose-6-phosphate synthase [Corynebacterium sphenisci]